MSDCIGQFEDVARAVYSRLQLPSKHVRFVSTTTIFRIELGTTSR